MIKVFILISMIFCHIVDDYYSQGILASMKQKDWWKNNSPDKLYKYDYLMALFMHSFSWAFMIMIVPTIYSLFVLMHNRHIHILILFVINVMIHAIVDDLKANRKKINLIQDQTIHLLQIIFTWLIIIF